MSNRAWLLMWFVRILLLFLLGLLIGTLLSLHYGGSIQNIWTW